MSGQTKVIRNQSAAAIALLLLTTAAAATARPVPAKAVLGAAPSPAIAHPRLLPLEGGVNFRDLGGYRSTDGRRVRWGLLYRSGSMADLTDRDYNYLSRLGIRAVCDLRSRNERSAAPLRWRAAKVSYWTSDLDLEAGDLGKLFRPGAKPTAQATQLAMMDLYKGLPWSYAGHFREIFQQIDKGLLPLAFNCTAGKDRTGLAAALILSGLGVPRRTILYDYALSDKIVDYRRIAGPSRKSELASALASFPPGAVAALMRSDPAYLQAALVEIERRHGSVQAYLRDVLGVTPAAMQQMRNRLLV